MHLDRTRIAVRQREFTDLLDLALHVASRQIGGLLFWLAIGIVPCLAANAVFFSGAVELMLEDEPGFFFGYPWLLVALMLCQEPLATAPATLYLGRTMFLERPRPRRIVLDWLRAGPQLILFLVLPRFVVALCLPLAALLVALRPHLAEIILLERTPLRGKPGGEPTTWTRSTRLHGAPGEIMARVVLGGIVALLLTTVFWLMFGFLHAQVLGAGDYWYWMWLVYLPAAMWMAVGYRIVVRFLSYLDLRIRQEGWELELQMRAEAARLAATIA